MCIYSVVEYREVEEKNLLQNEKKIKDADVVKHAHAMRAGIIGVKSEIEVLGKRPN